MSLSRELLLQPVSGPSVKTYTFPEDYPEPFGGAEFHVRIWTSKERSSFEASLTNKSGSPDKSKYQSFSERLLVATLCDENGILLMAEADISSLSNQDGRIIGYSAEAAATANSISAVDVQSLSRSLHC